MKKKYALTFLTLSLFAFNSYSQALKYCGSDEMNAKALREHPELQQQVDAMEQYTESYRQQEEQQLMPPVYIIPVVFHIIHEYGPENISDAQIIDAVNILNKDYRKLNTDISQVSPTFAGIAADAEIEFRLAKKDPNGNCTTGIDRIYSPLTNNADDNSKLNPWNHTKYLNVWVVKTIGQSGVAGYSYFPASIPNANVDGVLILSDYIGSIGTGSPLTSRALTHEIGHFLNLKHTWGSTNSPGVACGNDNVTDTPVTMGWTSCNLTNNDVCNANVEENVENYMEYAYCSKMFTNGQKTRMRTALTSSTAGRNNLWTASNLTATGVNTTPVCVPISDFTASTTSICAGTTVNFSWWSNGGHPTTWSWNFPGGTPATSPDSFPSVVYSTPGVYNVSLTVSNSAGSSTYTRTAYINVLSNTATYNSFQYIESFENVTSFPSTDWSLTNVGNGNVWSITTSAAKTGVKSAKFTNAVSDTNKVDELIGPSFDLSAITNPIFTFQVADAQRTSSDNDKLQVYVSANCGQTWALRYTKSGATLKTAGPMTSAFVPNSSQWRQETVNVSPYVSANNLRVKFVFTSDGGNNCYIDDINIVGASSVNELENLISLGLFPNPMNESAVLTFDLPAHADMHITLCDITGRRVAAVFNGQLAEGKHEFSISKDNLESGIYFLHVEANGQALTKKMIIN